jgi:MYXO-CTERM domain-containing protein
MLGSGDALQIQLGTRLYVSRSSVRGYGDNLLSYGAAFFKNCDFISTYGPHGWPRNPNTNHGDVFLNSTFSLDGVAAPPAGTGALGTSGDGHCDLARSPSSGASFPYAEFVLISCKLADISPAGWGEAGPDYSNVHFWEYNSVNLSDGMAVDVSKRVSYSRQLTMAQDADTIANYSNPSYVLAGWTPELAPVILTQLPDMLNIPLGGSAELAANVAAEPTATFQWAKDGQALTGQTDSSLKLDSATPGVSGVYTVSIQNSAGKVASNAVTVVVGPPGAQLPTAGSAGTVGAGAAGMPAAGTSAGARAGSGAAAGAMAAAAGASANPGTAGTAVPQAGATGTMTGSIMTTPTPNTQAPQRSRGGCSVGTARGNGEAWPVALAALLTLVGARRRRRVC